MRDKLLTPPQAAERLGVSANTVRRWADAGLIRVVKTPTGRRFFDPAAIDRLVQELTPASTLDKVEFEREEEG